MLRFSFHYEHRRRRLSGLLLLLLLLLLLFTDVKWVLCHHGMARPQFADGGDSLQIWRVAANILNKQSRTADRGWSSSLGG
jgi:hypothetical protein